MLLRVRDIKPRSDFAGEREGGLAREKHLQYGEKMYLAVRE